MSGVPRRGCTPQPRVAKRSERTLGSKSRLRILPWFRLPQSNSGVLRMLRSIRLFIGAAAVLCGGFVLAQPKDTPNADGYFPLKPKTKWTYKIQDQTIEVVV